MDRHGNLFETLIAIGWFATRPRMRRIVPRNIFLAGSPHGKKEEQEGNIAETRPPD